MDAMFSFIDNDNQAHKYMLKKFYKSEFIRVEVFFGLCPY